MSAAPASALLAAIVVTALLAEHTSSVAVICLILLVVALRAPAKRRWPYLLGTLTSAVFVFALTPFVESIGSHPLWVGPTIPVIGQLDVTTEELRAALYQALRLAAVGLAFADYALLVDHDRLLASAGWARRSALAVALATRLVPTLERDARDMQLALRGRGVKANPIRLMSPLLAGSLERGLNLAEAMEARGYGGGPQTHAPRPPWRHLDRAALVASVALIVVGALWL